MTEEYRELKDDRDDEIPISGTNTCSLACTLVVPLASDLSSFNICECSPPLRLDDRLMLDGSPGWQSNLEFGNIGGGVHDSLFLCFIGPKPLRLEDKGGRGGAHSHTK